VSTPLRRALWARDRRCTFPGCSNKRYVDAHHIRHWADGGETTLENLTLLCSHHHRALHEGRFRIRRDADGAFYFQRPDGRAIPKAGYRLGDILDDDVGGEWLVDTESHAATSAESDSGGFGYEMQPSAEGFTTSSFGDRNPSAEVREARALYRVRPERACPATTMA
jgi:hypothetical protein